MDKKFLLFIGGLAVAVAVAVVLIRKRSTVAAAESTGEGSGKKTYPNPGGKSRGDRNNNPLNIRYSPANNWVGQIGSDGAFCQFDSRKNGYRAAFKNLFSYIKNGNNTIKKIITRWAPPSDGNNTTGYIDNVASRSGIDKDLQIAVTDKDKLCKIVREMAKIESLLDPTDWDLMGAYDLAMWNGVPQKNY